MKFENIDGQLKIQEYDFFDIKLPYKNTIEKKIVEQSGRVYYHSYGEEGYISTTIYDIPISLQEEQEKILMELTKLPKDKPRLYKNIISECGDVQMGLCIIEKTTIIERFIKNQDSWLSKDIGFYIDESLNEQEGIIFYIYGSLQKTKKGE